MKKNLFLAALAGVALVGCAKNEVAQVTDDSQREISFAAPVVAPVTKADYYTTENLGTGSVAFNVFGWYCEGSGEFDSSGAVPYMGTGTGTGDEIDSPVTVSYNSGNKDDINSGTAGYWAPTTPYYWPKNGKLTFSAYAPASASSHGKLSDNRATGLKFTNYQVQDIDAQYDLLYSLRTFDRTSSTEGTNNDIYDGVELTFCHALSAIEPIKVYTNGAGIRIKEINLKNVYNTGSFSQNMTSGHDDANEDRAWTSWDNEVDYCLFKAASDAEYYTVTNTSSPVTKCKNAIVMPQALNHSTTNNKVTIEVKYQIQHGSAYLDQVFTQELNGLTDTSSNVVASWNIGMRYTYTLVFDLNDIYFAPQVEVWDDVTMGGITIK